jgi:DNA-binding LytR/AlgR family response regulator
MNTTPSSLTVHKNLALLARVLERLDRSAQPVDAEQFRAVAERLAVALEAAPRDAALEALLATCPAASEMYENLNYRHAGLCRSALEPALAAEVAASAAIDGARRRAEQGPAASQA